MQPPRPGIQSSYFLIAWFVLNVAQAALTPLDPDETYYWMYAGQLDWGYFDHPPAVAVLIALARDWLPGALGLRLGHVLASTAAVGVLFHLRRGAGESDDWLMAALIFAQPMLQVYGFIATPDGPLLLFAALYLLAYRSFLERPSYGNAGWVGVAMAGLLYSKYHGLILILFTILPNLVYLVRKPAAWLAVGVGTLLFVPHLYWQYAHDYPSFRYHLSGRDDPYEFRFTVQYLLNQLVIFSPLLVYHYVLAFIRTVPTDRFDRSLRWLVAGFLLFFLYTTTKGRTEAQWTAVLSLPLVLLLYRAVGEFPTWRTSVLRLCYATAALLLIARILLLLPRDWLPFDKPFDHEPWVERLQAIAGDDPVVVENSYRYASLYEYYGGGPGWTFTDVDYRPSQYDLWHRDTLYHDRTVWILGQANWKLSDPAAFRTQDRDMRLLRVDSFQVVKDVRLEADFAARGHLRVFATAPRDINLQGPLPLSLHLISRREAGDYAYEPLSSLAVKNLPAHERTLLYSGPIPSGFLEQHPSDRLSVGLAYRGMPPLRDQSATYRLE